MARNEGVFSEPASNASIAGLIKLHRGKLPQGKKVVSVLTGNGLKDPDTQFPCWIIQLNHCQMIESILDYIKGAINEKDLFENTSIYCKFRCWI